jgi:methoxymalonate biosynthesis protein
MTTAEAPAPVPPGRLKCLVWDLDETVWCGRILDGDRPELRAGVQDVIVGLDRRGVLQSVASANIHDDAWPLLEAFGLAEYFVAPEIHFGPKHESVARILGQLDLRPADVAFIDDDPLERELVRSMLPAVTVLDADEAPGLLDHPRFAQPTVLTDVARARRVLARADLDRAEEEARHAAFVEFLLSCRLRFHGRPATRADIGRVLELGERTNRMNATGATTDLAAIEAALADPGMELHVASLRDRFGDYGLVAAAVVHAEGGEATVDGLWMSCRAGRRGLPNAFLTYLAQHATAGAASRLTVRYRRTADNRLAAIHLGTYGFAPTSREGTTDFTLALPDRIRPYDEWMAVS